MAVSVKIILFAALYIASFIEAAPVDTECECNDLPEAERETLMDFFKEIDPKQDEYPILPGESAPAVPCNCIEYNRKKRKTQPEASDEVSNEAPEEVATENKKVASEDKGADSEDAGEDGDWLDELPEDYGMLPGVEDKTCPRNHVRYGKYCVPIPGAF